MPKTYAEYKSLDELGLHVSIGRLNPPYATYDVQVKGKRLKVENLTPENKVDIDDQGKAIMLEDTNAKYLMKGLDSKQVSTMNTILDVKDYKGQVTPKGIRKTILENKRLPEPSFDIKNFEFTAKYDHDNIAREAIFSIQCH
jgi:hypothetical protein